MNGTDDRILNERYRIASLIGRGGMADVYLAHDLSLDREVAIKMLRPDLARDPQFQGRFRREAQSSASLNHPNIVGVYDTGRTDVEDSHEHAVQTPFIVMEYVDGVTLRHIMHGTPRPEGEDTQETGRRDQAAGSSEPVGAAPHGSSPQEDPEQTQAGSPFDADAVPGDEDAVPEGPDVLDLADSAPESAEEPRPAAEVGSPLQARIDEALNKPVSDQEAVDYLSGILGALGYSHSRGIVHRDIKPSNVMVTQSGDVKVMDFGIARAMADTSSTMTQTSTVVGTAQYLSPEQARGEIVDHRSDLYSAGCVLFELLTNRPPFQGESPVSVAYQHVREEPPRVSRFNAAVSPAVESVVAKALAKDPELRFQSAAEFDQALSDALRGIHVASAHEAAYQEENPTQAVAAVPAAVGAAAAGGAGAAAAPSARTPEDPAVHEAAARGGSSRRRGLIWLWIVLMVLLIAVGAWALTRMLDAQNTEIPDVAGMPRAEAVEELEDADIDPESETVADDDVEEDHAVGTDPEAGTRVGPEDDVTLLISAGPDQVAVPEGLQGSTEEEAREALEDVGLEVGEVTDGPHPTVEEGMLVDFDPEAGTMVSRGTEVDLVLSNGLVELPDVTGMSESEAVALLQNDYGLQASTYTWEIGDVPAGQVLSMQSGGTDVTGGSQVPQGSTISLAISTPPRPDPTPEDEGDDDETEEPDEEETTEEPDDEETDEDETEEPEDEETTEEPDEEETTEDSSPTDEDTSDNGGDNGNGNNDGGDSGNGDNGNSGDDGNGDNSDNGDGDDD
ncbi:protein kinase domain-containing protein [Nesterenkonia aerolata]|uniref:non-specific serine/threonine protein kinase n=1 Tax=Nesterenkonia aerolata TaxID=3074079 RepID=A0ABU2DUM1_9MICC|nr:PASTA domain-containing protein [Nesterenkonia sp. LY-0111]MDR8020091.1 PASTA domain-containing protein [Nesterenkonia sp. LY-0111]